MKPWEPGALILIEPQSVGDAIRECAEEINRLRAALREIAQLEAHYADTPWPVKKAREALGCKRK